MAPIGSSSPYCDFKYVGWWSRTFGPKCPHCHRRMEPHNNYARIYGLAWLCSWCDWFTFFKEKGK